MLPVRCKCGPVLLTSRRKSLRGEGPSGVCVHVVHGIMGNTHEKAIPREVPSQVEEGKARLEL